MSADYWLQADLGGPEPVEVSDWFNVTYNLGPMLRAAGFPDWRALVGAPASEVGGMLINVANTLDDNRPRFTPYNPENGWGDIDGAIRFCRAFAAACMRAPRATVGAWL